MFLYPSFEMFSASSTDIAGEIPNKLSWYKQAPGEMVKYNCTKENHGLVATKNHLRYSLENFKCSFNEIHNDPTENEGNTGLFAPARFRKAKVINSVWFG